MLNRSFALWLESNQGSNRRTSSICINKSPSGFNWLFILVPLMSGLVFGFVMRDILTDRYPLADSWDCPEIWKDTKEIEDAGEADHSGLRNRFSITGIMVCMCSNCSIYVWLSDLYIRSV